MNEDKEAGDELTENSREVQESIESETEIQTAIEKLRKEKPSEVTEILAMMGVGPISNLLHQKINSTHITQILELSAEHDKRE